MERGNSSGTSAAETLLDCCGMPAEHGPTSTYDWAAVSAAVCVDLLQQIRCHAGDRYFRRLLWSGRTHVTLERGSMQSTNKLQSTNKSTFACTDRSHHSSFGTEGTTLLDDSTLDDRSKTRVQHL